MKKIISGDANPAREVRLVRLVNMLRQKSPISREELETALEVSRATLTRDIAKLRDQLNMPIAFDKEAGGYIIAETIIQDGPRYELPGLWISGAQAWGILTLVNVLSTIDPGVLKKTLEPLRFSTKQLVGIVPGIHMPPVHDKLTIEIADPDCRDSAIFQYLSAALYKDLEARLTFVDARLPATKFSLQRFALTRDGWFIDAYDRQANKVLRIPVQIIQSVTILETQSIRLPTPCPWDDYDEEEEVGDGNQPHRTLRCHWHDLEGERIPFEEVQR